jgi:acyl carrier protein
MNASELKSQVLTILGGIAPEADLSHLAPGKSLRDQIDIDSMDFLNFIIALHQQLHVDIPEADYPQLATLDGCLRYLSMATEKPS